MRIEQLERARMLGLSRYFTGKPCRNGHMSERYTKTCICVQCVKERAEYYATWQRKNKDKVNARNKRYREKHRELYLARKRKYRELHPGVTSVYKARRRALLNAASGSFSSDDVKALLKLQKNKCVVCRERLPSKGFHVDHIMPLSMGGTNDKLNIQILCATCNRRKWAKHPLDFAREEGRLL